MSIILNEQKIVSSDDYNMYIEVFPRDSRPGYLLDPYMKVYNNKKLS